MHLFFDSVTCVFTLAGRRCEALKAHSVSNATNCAVLIFISFYFMQSLFILRKRGVRLVVSSELVDDSAVEVLLIAYQTSSLF